MKHISLDLWNTLLISNSIFSNKRADYFSQKYFKDINKSLIRKRIEKIGIETDRTNMTFGISISSESMYEKLFSEMGGLPNRKELEKIYLDLEIIFLKNLPKTMYEIDVLVKCFKELKLKGYSLNISSNTAFIKGKTLIKVLESLQIKKYFDFFIFSDEIKLSKPSIKFFDCLISNCKKLGVDRNNITHIGDSLEADIFGAQQSKIKSIHVKKDEFKLVNLLGELQ